MYQSYKYRNVWKTVSFLLDFTWRELMAHTLNTFVRNFCSNFYENSCVLDETCKVLDGKPCQFFEKWVYPECDPGYIFSTEKDSHRKVLRDYQKIKKSFKGLKIDNIRTCECGKPLMPHKRYCDSCRESRRRQSIRAKSKCKG